MIRMDRSYSIGFIVVVFSFYFSFLIKKKRFGKIKT